MENEIEFTNKEMNAVLAIVASVLQDMDDDDSLDVLEQSALGPVLDSLSDDELAHYGVLGMKWGIRRATRKSVKLEKQTRRIERRYDSGKGVDKSLLLKRDRVARKYSYRTTKRINKLNKFIKRSESGKLTIANRLFKTKPDPIKIEKAKEYLAESETLRQRYRDIGARLTSLKIDALL